jgi:RNA polymerase-binding transcription factor DksA
MSVDLDTARTLLAEERASLTEQRDQAQEAINTIRDSRSSREDRADAGSGSNDGDPLSVETENLIRLLHQAEDSLAQVDAATARLGAGTYGICTACGQEIAPARLEAMPYTDRCVSCKQGTAGLRL